MTSLTSLKRAVEEIESVEGASIQRRQGGTNVVDVRSNDNIIDELDELIEEGKAQTFQPEGKFFGEYQYMVR